MKSLNWLNGFRSKLFLRGLHISWFRNLYNTSLGNPILHFNIVKYAKRAISDARYNHLILLTRKLPTMDIEFRLALYLSFGILLNSFYFCPHFVLWILINYVNCIFLKMFNITKQFNNFVFICEIEVNKTINSIWINWFKE